MKEWCGCGSGIHARYSRIKEWRTQHHCPVRATPEPEPQGAHAQVELAYQPDGVDNGVSYTPTINARIGFTPNEG